MWIAGIRGGNGDVSTNQFTFHGYFKNDVPHGPGKMSFQGCEQHGEYIMTDVFVRKNGMLETIQEPTWRCSELTYSGPSVDHTMNEN